MPKPDMPKHATIELVVGAIADWVNKYRLSFGDGGLDRCGPDEVNQIAKDLGISTSQLQDIVDKGPGAADLLRKMLAALHVDLEVIATAEPAVLRDLQRLCAACDRKSQCRHEMAAGTAAAHFHEFCPNAFTLDALLEQKAASARH
jgi:hypothetical protein